MVTITRYSPERKQEWDAFVRTAKNGLFLFQREYMDYHADRYIDHSLLFSKENKLVAVMPANICDRVLTSHAGLTFGGFLIDEAMTTRVLLDLLGSTMTYLREEGIGRWLYKCVPSIYHDVPAEEDRYALFIHGAKLYRRDVTSTIAPALRPHVQERRRRSIKKARAACLATGPSNDWPIYWPILEENLQRVHGAVPVHTLGEIELLRARFPDNIKLFATYQDKRLLAGLVVYEHRHVAHAQYVASSDAGRQVGALDLLFEWLIEDHYRDKRYFDFGISTQNNGRVLNEGLIDFKEGFGARAVVHDFYELDLASGNN